MRDPSKSLQLVLAMLVTSLLFAFPSQAQSTMTYSPLTGSPDPASTKIKTEMYCCPSTALLIKASQPVGANDLEWVILGLSVPGTAVGRRITGVEVCYEIKAPVPDTAYISQTRLTDMTTPNVANVRLDDGTKRTAAGPKCYKTAGTGTTAPFVAKGTVTLALRVVLSNPRDEIRVGMVRLYF
jgi:hypothetical protein